MNYEINSRLPTLQWLQNYDEKSFVVVILNNNLHSEVGN